MNTDHPTHLATTTPPDEDHLWLVHKLRDAASDGDSDAVKAVAEVMDRMEYQKILSEIDDDETY